MYLFLSFQIQIQKFLKNYQMSPGTFHHSLNIANLAEACADKVGANVLLSRVRLYIMISEKLRILHFY